MDLLLAPADPAFPTDDTPYLAGDKRWERGHFLTYAGRDSSSAIASLKTLEREELGGHLQTWLFFGLVAEFLGLNEQEDGQHIVDSSQAEAELDVLYEESVIVKEDGGKYITGLKVLSLMPLILKRVGAGAETVGGIGQRLIYLDHCVNYPHEVTARWDISKVLLHGIKYSLAALGELFSEVLQTVNYENRLQLQLISALNTWSRGYLVAGGWLEGQMLAHGWCSSEIEKFRTELVSIQAMHYVSRLRKIGPRKDHSRCHKYRCVSFQIRMDSYQPAHVEQCRGCDLLDVDLDGTMSILEKTHSFPVLTGKTAWNEVHKRDEAQVEAFELGIPYVAISHVWADGLGNPTANALPWCQLDRLHSLVAKLQKTVEPDWEERGRSPYRLWVDPLCCPVELNGKSIALGRIADVYRNATHVLVLDASFTTLASETVEPAELAFRAMSCSAWMRRLWTFQEGALARSLYYQFADYALTSETLLSKIEEAAIIDLRYERVFRALHELMFFREFTPHIEPGSPEHTPNSARGTGDVLWWLQHAFNFRSVSVPRDEPLCIATMLGLDINRVANENGENVTQKRMAIVWEMMARRLGGIPPRIIFSVDNPLDIRGFRWAPKSLLTPDVDTERPSFDLAPTWIERLIRFQCGPDTKLAQLISEGDRKGLRVSYPGFKVFARPYSGVDTALEQYRLYPWDGVLEQDYRYNLMLKEEDTGRWFIATESRITSCSTDGDICTQFYKVIRTGQCAIIRETAETVLGFDGMPKWEYSLIMLVKKEDETEFIVQKQLTVRLKEATEAQVTVAETMTELAEELASEQVTADFIAVRDQIELDECALVCDKLRNRMQELVAEAWEARPDFAEAVKVSEGEYNKDYLWVDLAKRYSHRAILERLPDDQLWLID